MPRVRMPSMKVRQNMESVPLEDTPSTSTSARRTSTRTAAAKTPVPATPTTSTPAPKRGRGRPKGSKTSAAKKKQPGKVGRPRTHKKGKPWEDDPDEDQIFGYDSYSSESDGGGEDDEFYPDLMEPTLPEEEEHLDHHHEDYSYTKLEPGEELEGAILCPWLEFDQVDELVLPESSLDIPVINDYVMDMIEMYEILRSYSRTLRLSPFIFEDFCAAMSSPENSCLLAEVHIALLKACLRSDDEEQVHYSANDSNNAVNIAIFSLDSMTYAEVLRMYLEGDRARGRVPEEILNAINSPNYPFVSVDVRASVITYLCYRFLDTNEYKKVVASLGKLMNEEACRACSKSGGELFSCAYCEYSFHPNCINQTEREDVWICDLCGLNCAKGVSNCLPLDQAPERQPLRMTPIGRDRHGRIYWFVVRRIIIQEEEGLGLWYYSTAPQLFQLVKMLDPTYYEYQLCKTLNQHLPDILEQMAVTIELTTEKNQAISTEQQSKSRPVPPAPYLQNDNLHRMHLILKDPEVESKKEEDVKDEEMDEEAYQTPCQRMLPMLGVSGGRLVNNFWSGSYEEEDVLSFDHSKISTDPASLFCMGHFKWDDTFKKYKNNYALHDYGEATAVKKKATDRKKYLATRFTLLEEGEDAFKWSMAKGKDMYGPERQQTKYLEWTIGKLLKKVPVEMMHRRWPGVVDEWRANLAKAESYEDLATALVKAECCMRRTLFLPQFWNSLGVTRLTRTTIDDREQISKDIQKRKKDEKDLSNPDYSDDVMIKVNYTRLAAKACPQGLWRQKDELFRLCGRGELGGWIWVSRALTRRIRPLPERPPLGLFDREVSEEEKKKPAVKKALRLDSLAQKLMEWRENEEKTKQQIQVSKCYSPNCRSGFPKRLVCGDEDVLYQACYSYSCRNSPEIQASYSSTSAVAKARDVSRISPARTDVLGEGDEQWSLNEPTSFASKTSGKKSILVIPDVILRKLARQGGRLAIYIPNFSMSAKSNYSLWNYPCQRPCFDLCWKWLTTNARSLHAVSLQLKILWFCIKWAEFLPAEDDSDDGRVIVHHPDRDELRQVVKHKEFPPQGTYERYMLKVESVMLDDEGDDDEYLEKTDRKRKRENNRPKRAAARLATQRRNPTRFEWVDGVELKVFEIRSYWQSLNYDSKELERKRNRVLLSKDVVSVRDLQKPKITYSVLQQSNPNSPAVCSPIVTSNRGGVPMKYSNMQPGTSSATPASLLADRRKRVVLKNNEYGYEDSDYDPYESPRPGEPLAKKARMIVQHNSSQYTPRVAYTAASPVVYTTDSPARRTANGYEFNGGILRGGGRVQPVGDGMRRVVGATGVPQVAAEETVTTSNTPSTGMPRMAAGGNEGDDMPPLITRYDSTTYGGQPAVSSAASQQPRAMPAGSRQVMYTSSQRATPHNLVTAGGKVLMIRKNDGSTQYLRPVPKEDGTSPPVRTVSVAQPGVGDQSNGVGGAPVRRIVTAVGNRPGTIVRTVGGAGPTRIVRLGPQNQPMMALPPGARLVTRLPANGTAPRASPVTTQAAMQGQTFRRVVQPRQVAGEYVGDEAFSGDYAGEQVMRRAGPPVARVPQGYSYGRPVQRVVSRGGATMHVGQRMVQDGYRRVGGPGNNVRRVTSYREFCMKRGIVDFMRSDPLPARPYRFDFESNEDEERAIAEAIAREEEIMRQEEEENKRDQERQWNHPRIIDKFGQVGSAMLHQLSKQPIQFSSNLMPAKEDTSDMKQIKQTLDSLITQVCRWDKQYGWFKAHQKRPKGRMDLDKLKTRRMFSNQRELMLSEHVDRLRKEINKRRTRMENEAEHMTGLPTPWRKAKTKSSKSKPRTQSPAVKEVVTKAPAAAIAPAPLARVVNPAEISLGGDSLTDWPPLAEATKLLFQEDDELVEDVQPPPAKRVKMEVADESGDGGSPRRKPPTIPKSDRVLRTRVSSHSEAEESSATGRSEQKKRGRPRKEVVPMDAGAKDEESDGPIEHGVPDGMNPEEPHCICRQPYNPKKFYINCDLCSGWFHGKCVEVTEEDTKTMTGWSCPTCTEEARKAEEQQPLYCVCQTPYDDTLFYVGCDGCEDWFHPACVGITQKFAESVSEYMCPRCSAAQQEQEQEGGGYESDASTSSVSVPLSRADYPLIWRVLEIIAEHRMAWPFKEPVELAQFPNYNEVITHPMDLSTMQKKLERLEYIRLKDFSHDMNQMFENARIFNAKDSPIYLCADTLEKIFEQQLAEVKAEMTNRINQDRRKPSESHTVDSSLDIDTDQLVDVQLDLDPSMYDQLF